MRVNGKLHRITNLNAFVASYLQTGGKPTAGFSPYGRARLHIATDMPGGQFSGGFVPSMSLKTDADGDGDFSFTVGDSLTNFRGQLVAYKISQQAAPLPGMPPIPVLDPIFRSTVFKFSDLLKVGQFNLQKIYIYEATTPTASGISQAELNQQVSALRSQLGLDQLKATVGSGRVSVRAEKSGGEVKFSAYVRGSTSTDLERVIEVKAGEIDIDLPGPDFIVGLCVNEDQIEAQIRKGLSGLSKQVSQELLAELDRQAPGVSSQATISVWRTRFVQTGTTTVKIPVTGQTMSFPSYTVVPDAAFGVPKTLRWADLDVGTGGGGGVPH